MTAVVRAQTETQDFSSQRVTSEVERYLAPQCQAVVSTFHALKYM